MSRPDPRPRYREIRELAILGADYLHLLEDDEYAEEVTKADGSIRLRITSEEQVTLYQTTLFMSIKERHEND